MKRLMLLISTGLIIGLLLIPGITSAEDKFPNRPVDFVCPFGIGGGADRVARALSAQLEKEAGVAFPVVNARGGMGQTGLIKVKDAPADGYMPVIVVSDLVVTDLLGKTKLQLKEFRMLARVLTVRNMLFVRADSPFKTVRDLIAAGKKKKLKFGVPVPYCVESAEVENFGKHFGVQVKKITNPKFGKKIAAFMGGQMDVLLEQYGDMKPYLEAKQVRPLFYFGPERMTGLPDVPCAQDLGLNQTFEKYWFILLKKGTPADRVAALEKLFARAAQTKEYREFLTKQFTSLEESWLGSEESAALLDKQYSLLTEVSMKLGWLK